MVPMKLIASALLTMLPLFAGADAQTRRGDQDDVYHGRREGALKPLRDIENGLVPAMKRRGADYIGAEFDSIEQRYRLKFVRNGGVIWVDVDGRTGGVVAQAGE